MSIISRILNIIKTPFGWFAKISWKKKIAAIVILLIVFFIARSRLSKSETYATDTVSRRDITELVTESGAISTIGGAVIYSPTSGIVSDVYVANGDSVKEGQKLFSVESTATQQEVAAAYAAYRSAISSVQQAENTRRSTQATVDKVHDDVKDHDSDESFTQKQTRTTAEVANDNAYDVLQAAQASLVSAQSAYSATQNATVKAPLSGNVSNLSVIKGSNVIINNALAPTTAVLRIGESIVSEIAITVGESDVNKVEVGQKAKVELDAISDKIFDGEVVRIDEVGTTTQGVVSFNVYVELENPDERIKSGMTADVDIITKVERDVLSVPNASVKPYQSGRAVRVQGEQNKIEYKPITVGIRGAQYTEILMGLDEGEEIIISLTNEQSASGGPLGI